MEGSVLKNAQGYTKFGVHGRVGHLKVVLNHETFNIHFAGPSP